MKDTKIEWADDSANPWWGCNRVSPACTHCYAADVAARFRPADTLWGPGSARALRLDAFEHELKRIANRGKREGRLRRVFIASMCDVFEDRDDLGEPRKRVWDILHCLAGDKPQLVPMVLTKRPDVMAAWAKEHGWPVAAWAGCTVEDHRRAEERVPYLLQVPAAVRFLSMEPLLEGVRLDPLWLETGAPPLFSKRTARERCGWVGGINWIIVGGESGPHARPMHPAWARSLRDQAVAAGVFFHFKQWGEWAPEDGSYVPTFRSEYVNWSDGTLMWRVGKRAAGRLLGGRTWDEVPTP